MTAYIRVCTGIFMLEKYIAFIYSIFCIVLFLKRVPYMRKIKIHTKQRFIALAVLLILAISIGYAALSTTLTINGTANIASNSWPIYFTNVQVTTGSVAATTVPSTNRIKHRFGKKVWADLSLRPKDRKYYI